MLIILFFYSVNMPGLVFNKVTKQPVANAQIIVEGIGKNITTTSKGEYWRLLVPGNYTIQCFADG